MFDRLLALLIEGETQRTFPFHQEKEDNKKLIRSVRRSRAGLNVSINRRQGGPSRRNNPNQRLMFKLESSNRSPERVAKVTLLKSTHSLVHQSILFFYEQVYDIYHILS